MLSDGGSRVWLVQGNGMCHSGRGNPVQVGGVTYGSDHRRTTPRCQLGSRRPDTAENALHQDGLPSHGSVTEHGPMGSDPRDTEACADLAAHYRW